LLQVVGKGGFGAAADFLGESVATGISEITPDVVKEPILQFVGEAVGKALDTDVAKRVSEEWNKLDETTQSNLESSGNIMAFLLPKLRAGRVGSKIKGYGQAVKKERLAKFLTLPDTPANKLAEAKRMFKEPAGFSDMVDQVSKIRGVSPNKSPKSNILAVGKELDKTDKKLLMRLRTNPAKVDQNLIDDTVDLHLRKLLDENAWIQTDSAIASSFDTNLKTMQGILNKNPKTPEGILLSRRAFDKAMAKKALEGKAPDSELIARDAVSRVLRRALNDVVDTSSKNVDVKKALKKQSNLYKSLDNLSETYSVYSTTFESLKDFAKAHPYLAWGVAGGTGVGAAIMSPEGVAGGAATALGVGAYKVAPSVASKVGGAVQKAGNVVDSASLGLPIARSTLLYGEDLDK